MGWRGEHQGERRLWGPRVLVLGRVMERPRLCGEGPSAPVCVCVECETARLLVLLTERVDEGVVVCAGTSCPRVCTARCVWCAWEWACIELLTLCGFERVTGSVYLLRVGVCVS